MTPPQFRLPEHLLPTEPTLTEVIQEAIESEPMERRLYPDLYAEKVAKAIVATFGVGARNNDPATLEVRLT